jgi:hypothetical protein
MHHTSLVVFPVHARSLCHRARRGHVAAQRARLLPRVGRPRPSRPGRGSAVPRLLGPQRRWPVTAGLGALLSLPPCSLSLCPACAAGSTLLRLGFSWPLACEPVQVALLPPFPVLVLLDALPTRSTSVTSVLAPGPLLAGRWLPRTSHSPLPVAHGLATPSR